MLLCQLQQSLDTCRDLEKTCATPGPARPALRGIRTPLQVQTATGAGRLLDELRVLEDWLAGVLVNAGRRLVREEVPCNGIRRRIGLGYDRFNVKLLHALPLQPILQLTYRVRGGLLREATASRGFRHGITNLKRRNTFNPLRRGKQSDCLDLPLLDHGVCEARRP